MGEKYRFSGFTAGRQKPLNRTGTPDSLGHCNGHGKTLWSSRKAARRALRRRHPEGGKMPYRCDLLDGWHYGTASLTRDEYRGVIDGGEEAGREVDQGHDEQQQQGEREGPPEAQAIPA
jgi:hypothetical protein